MYVPSHRATGYVHRCPTVHHVVSHMCGNNFCRVHCELPNLGRVPHLCCKAKHICFTSFKQRTVHLCVFATDTTTQVIWNVDLRLHNCLPHHSATVVPVTTLKHSFYKASSYYRIAVWCVRPRYPQNIEVHRGKKRLFTVYILEHY